jgi:hypothetical protein
MNKILEFIKNNASLTVITCLVLICAFSLKFQEEKPQNVKLELAVQPLANEQKSQTFLLTVKNADTKPYTYLRANDASGMPSRHFRAEVTTGSVTRKALNRGWDEIPFKIPADQIFISSKQNDGLGSRSKVNIEPGAVATSEVSLENLPSGNSQVLFTVDDTIKAAPVQISIP